MNKFTVALAILSGLAVVPAAALAMEPYLPASPKVFAKVDADKDGSITLPEFQPKAEKRFLALDGDKNGEVSAAEIDARLQKAIALRRDRILKAMDKDASGGVSKDELDRYVAALLKEADADGNGGVTFDEIAKLRVAKPRKPATGEGAN